MVHALNAKHKVVRFAVESFCNVSEIHFFFFFLTFCCSLSAVWIILNDLSGSILFWKAVYDVCAHLMDSQ